MLRRMFLLLTGYGIPFIEEQGRAVGQFGFSETVDVHIFLAVDVGG